MSTLDFDALEINEGDYHASLKTYFDNRSSTYGGEHHFKSCNEMLCQVPPHGKILDICAGTGFISIPALETDGVSHVTMIDLSSGMLEKARGLIREKGICEERYEIINGDVLKCIKSIESEGFDIVYCANALTYFAAPRHVMKEVSRVLKVGGVFCVQAPTFDSYASSIALDAAVDVVWRRRRAKGLGLFERNVFVRPHRNSRDVEGFCGFLREWFGNVEVPSVLELGGKKSVEDFERTWGKFLDNPLMSGVAGLEDGVREEIRLEWIKQLEQRRGVDNLIDDPVHSMTAVARK